MARAILGLFLLFSLAFGAELWEEKAKFGNVIFKKELSVLHSKEFEDSKFDFFSSRAKRLGLEGELKALKEANTIEVFLEAKAKFYANLESKAIDKKLFDLVDLGVHDKGVDKELLFASKIKKWYLKLEKENLKTKRRALDYLFKIKHYLKALNKDIDDAEFEKIKEAIIAGNKESFRTHIKELQPIILTLKSQKLAKEELEKAVKSFVRYNKLTAFDYTNGVDEEGNIKNTLEYTEAVIFSARAKEKILQIAPNIDKESFQKLLDIYEKILSNIQSKRGKKAVSKLTKEAKQILLDATGLKEVKETPAELVANVLNSFDGVKQSLEKNNFKQAEFFRLEAYSFFDPDIEQRLMPRDPSLTTKLEGLFWDGSGKVKGLGYAIAKKDKDLAYKAMEALEVDLAKAKDTLEKKLSYSATVMQSAMIIVREGLEAVLVLAILLALFKHRSARVTIWAGTILGIAASFATYYAAKELISISTLNRELIEGLSALLASAMLIFVTAWIFHNTYVKGWVEYAKELSEKALKSGSLLTILLVGFLVVYREGFETVLFYETLLNESNPTAVWYGFVGGTIFIIIVSYIIIKGISKLPINLFFTITGVFLSMLAVIFVGAGVRGLQTANIVSATPSNILPNWQWLSDYFGYSPTVETTLAQVGLIVFFVGLYLYSKFQNLDANQ